MAIKGGGRYGEKSGTPALASLVDIWDGMGAVSRREIFAIASGKFSSPESIAHRDNKGLIEAWTKVKSIFNSRHKSHGMKSTMQSVTQRDDLSVLEELIVKVRGGEGFYDKKSGQEIADAVHDELFPNVYVLKTGQRYNVEVNELAFTRNGMVAKDTAHIAQAHIIESVKGSEWGLMSHLTGDMTKEEIVANLKKNQLNIQLPAGTSKYLREDGQIMEKTRNADGTVTEKLIPTDHFNKLLAKTDDQIMQDLLDGESENLKTGLISVDDGYQIGVYLIPEGGGENQGHLLGTFLERVNGKLRPRHITEAEFVGYAASPYVVRFLSDPRFMNTNLHEYVRELRAKGVDRAKAGRMDGRISDIPFLRFLQKPGKLEFDHAIEPLHSMMEDRAKELGKDTLSYQEARELVDKLKDKQSRWFNKSYLPKFFKKGARIVSNWLQIPG